MTGNYREQDFESHIEEHLLASGYDKAQPTEYDRELCLIPGKVMEFLENTQPEGLDSLKLQYGDKTGAKICARLSSDIDRHGVLHVLRKGLDDRGVNLRFAWFKPASGLNPEHLELYSKNRFTVVRQVKYSKKNENSIDMVLFLNGIPIITMELKNSLTGQFVENAVKQYKKDRDPKEPLLQFRRCLVHFAVGNEKVYMTTRLNHDKTRFLPFNLDTENPVNPTGHKTAYLWEDILQPETLLDLAANYLHQQTDVVKHYKKGHGVVEDQKEVFIFPRYHQFDSVRKIISQVRKDGIGGSYLVQHSAGSGKSNSIAWLAHQLAALYQNPSDKRRLFDSVIVITDRKVLDSQLQRTIKQFEQTAGVVKPIDLNSAQLRDAIEKGKDIIVTTLQKFPVISASISELKGKRFAVIIDEAHSSQSGESTKHLKKTLSAGLEEAEEADRDDYDVEDEIIREIETRGRQGHISYFAFTATPKGKTLEMFGKKGTDGRFRAFHVYSMRQAIEEGFILDVLRNYTTFKRYFKLQQTLDDDELYEKGKVARLLTSFVDLQPHAIETKTRIMLDHFKKHVVNEIKGQARAMVVTRSRLHAVKFYLAFRKVMVEMGLKFKPLVAFSGTVFDPDTSASHTEASMNGLSGNTAIQDAFKTPEYRILIVANKFQTGFDEPLLHTMYVDKKLGGVNAVQTLSRLNRTHPAKTDTLVLDFVNDAEDIKSSFQDYYQTTFLEEETDPNKLYDLKTQLEQFYIFDWQDVEDFSVVFFGKGRKGEELQPILDRVVDIWCEKSEDEREDFRSLSQGFVRLYGFLSQIITFKDTRLEKLYVFLRSLNRKLPRNETPLPTEVLDAVDLDSFRIQETFRGSVSLDKDDGEVQGIRTGAPKRGEEEKDLLSRIIEVLNETFGLELTEEDKVDFETIRERTWRDQELRSFMHPGNSRDSMMLKFNQVLDDVVLEFVNTKIELYNKLSDPRVNDMLKQRLFQEYFQQAMAGQQGQAAHQ